MAHNAPPGLGKLIEKCQQIYPDQPNPLQVTTVLKYWLGGSDPLDYISMYLNPGNPALNIPPHWHYISFGLSDLHGDGRVHVPEMTGSPELRSGMGFELTFRLIKKDIPVAGAAAPLPDRPPTWPANLLQSLARYVFQTGNRLCVGDNVPWRKPLDNSTSQIQHMLIGEDPQMQRVETPFGWVDFCQIVGVTTEELEQASRWNGKGILNLLQTDSSTGGHWLITDMDRSKSVFELFPETLIQLENDLEREGSDLAGVNAEFTFKESEKVVSIKQEFIDTDLSAVFSDESLQSITELIKKEEGNLLNENIMSMSMNSVPMGQQSINSANSPFPSHVNNSLEMSCPLDPQQQIQSHVVHLEGLQLTLAPYAAKFLILAIKDRVRHGRHFTFKSQNLAVTFVAESVTGAVVSRDSPYGVLGYWVQVLITDDLVPRMLDSFKLLENNLDSLQLPTVFEWGDKNLKIVIDNPLTFSAVMKKEEQGQGFEGYV